MTIVAKRFSYLDKETNVPIGDFLDTKTSDLFNSPNLTSTEMPSNLQNFLSQSVDSANFDFKKASAVANDSIDESLIRVAKDTYSSIKDVSKLSQKDIDAYVEKLFPNSPTATSAYKKIAASCRTGPLSRYNAGRRFDPTVNCNGSNKQGKSGGCSVDNFTDVLNKLSGGQYDASYRDLNQSLSNLVALATNAYNMNLCGAFSVLSGGIPNIVGSRGASMVLGTLGASSNLRGVFDLASSTSGSDYFYKQEAPNAISNIFSNFKRPFDAKEISYTNTMDSIGLSMEVFDDKWDTSEYDDISSVCKMPSYSEDFDGILKSKTVDHSFSEDDLDSIPNTQYSDVRLGLQSRRDDLPTKTLSLSELSQQTIIF